MYTMYKTCLKDLIVQYQPKFFDFNQFSKCTNQFFSLLLLRDSKCIKILF